MDPTMEWIPWTQGHFADGLSDDGLFNAAFLTTVFPTMSFSDDVRFNDKFLANF